MTRAFHLKKQNPSSYSKKKKKQNKKLGNVSTSVSLIVAWMPLLRTVLLVRVLHVNRENKAFHRHTEPGTVAEKRVNFIYLLFRDNTPYISNFILS